MCKNFKNYRGENVSEEEEREGKMSITANVSFFSCFDVETTQC